MLYRWAGNGFIIMEVKIMLKPLRYFFSVATFSLAVYSLITKDYTFTHLLMLLMGLTLLLMGLEEFKKERKANGTVLISVFLFALFVSIQGFLLS